ncbi:hypothetical protein SAMN05444920_1576 [Nonomuraea solani]|uniref:Uncharacterized protein n=1 Tax=Nonomuraea solani TaxID=1144553 RepID=A0A1H6F4R3_9ACTN|nr:DUF5994 family protein [Nonomuraea solani]SEH04086.1 hypothetical protein SAMN05444920_1576 [Nonomuraea solani]
MPNRHSSLAPIALRPARVFLEPTLTRDGTLDGAWWPHSCDLRRELPALVRFLQDRLGPILRVGLDTAAWDEVPAHLLIDGCFVRVSGLPATPNTIRVMRGGHDGFRLLVVPPRSAGSMAAAVMRTAASTGNTLSANEILAPFRPLPRSPVTGMRPYQDSDSAAVLALIDADRLPGRPPCTSQMLGQALAGTARHDPWDDLDPPRTDILADADGRVAGVVSYAAHRDRSAGHILWLHGHEVLDVVEDLVRHALHRLGGGEPVHAFTAAPGQGPAGPAALPTGHRPVTRKVLEHAGFVARSSWRYLRRTTPCDPRAPAGPAVEVIASSTPPGWWLKARDDDASAELVAQEPIGGLGVLWWFGAVAGHADEELERALLFQADALLREHGASETILYATGDPEPSWALFDAAGFAQIDHLVSFTRPNAPVD